MDNGNSRSKREREKEKKKEKKVARQTGRKSLNKARGKKKDNECQV
jgi:hypothetical protein